MNVLVSQEDARERKGNMSPEFNSKELQEKEIPIHAANHSI